MKKYICKFLAVMTVITSLGCPVFASENVNQTSDIIIVHEDVSHDEAMSDPSYNLSVAEALSGLVFPADDVVSWNVWGEKGYQTIDEVDMARAIGYSQQLRNGWVTATYHYTRTLLLCARRGLLSCGVVGRWRWLPLFLMGNVAFL